MESLRSELGPNHEIRYPRMPDEGDPSYATWKGAFENELAAVDECKRSGPALLNLSR